jgi:tRNA pseudouridine38-40 synthase
LFLVRYFAELAYKGTHYFGWQRQPDRISIQETVEDAFSTILRTPIEVVGCGRTDTGVHAGQYFMHYDFEGEYPDNFLVRINKFLPRDIAIRRLIEVHPDAHARYDAVLRSYVYHIHFRKDPFLSGLSYHYPYSSFLDIGKLQEAAGLLLRYEEFFPFCKSDTDVKTMRCALKRSEWVYSADEERLAFHISADRFLRGMVRLIVGMCLTVARGHTPIEVVKEALDEQKMLPKAWSVPPEGLFLSEVKYPFV